MPRRQLDILKDLCCAHRDGDEIRYQEAAQEFVRYLKWENAFVGASRKGPIFVLKDKPFRVIF